jgi:hypothetical protein
MPWEKGTPSCGLKGREKLARWFLLARTEALRNVGSNGCFPTGQAGH